MVLKIKFSIHRIRTATDLNLQKTFLWNYSAGGLTGWLEARLYWILAIKNRRDSR
jgi:hypothetical protein